MRSAKDVIVLQRNPENDPPQVISLQDFVAGQTTNTQIPFKNYHALSNYLQANPKDTPAVVSFFITKHIPSEVNCTNDVILDFAQLMYCHEAVADTVFNKLYKLIENNITTCYEILGAVVIACDALQAQSYEKPENVELIRLLVLLTNNVVKTNIDLTSVPNSQFVVRALAAINAVFNLLIIRGISNPNGIATMGEIPHKALSESFSILKKNLWEFRAQHPWAYFLCCQAQQSLDAVQSIRTAVQQEAAKKNAIHNLGQAIIAALQALFALGGGAAALGLAIAATVAGFGAPAPTLIPAVIAVGVGCLTAYNQIDNAVNFIRAAYKDYRGQTTSSLNSFQRSMRISFDTVGLIPWNKIQAFLINLLKKIRNAQINNPIEKWSDTDKMAIVYYFTEMLLQTNAPSNFLRSIKQLFVEIYWGTTDRDKYSHVIAFILDSFQRISHNTNYQNVFPQLSVKNYKNDLIDLSVKKSKIKKQKQHLGDKIKRVDQSAQHRPAMLESISEHQLLQDAWFNLFNNDKNLYLLHEYLTALNEKVVSGCLTEVQARIIFAQIYKSYDTPEFVLASELSNMTSSWGQEFYKDLSQLISKLSLTQAEDTLAAPKQVTSYPKQAFFKPAATPNINNTKPLTLSPPVFPSTLG